MKNKVTAYKIYKELDKKFPFITQEDWDKSGIQNWKVRGVSVQKVVLCLDINKEVIEYAKNKGCNLIVSHHPIRIKESKLNEEKMESLNKNKIAAISCHTNFDNSKEGTNYYISKMLGLENAKKDKDSCMFFAKNTDNMEFKKIASRIKSRLPNSKIIGYEGKKEIKKIGLVGGSGASFIDYAISKKIDLFITGDIKWHDWTDAIEQGLSLIDIGHIQEKVIIEGMENFFNTYFPSIKTYHFQPKDYGQEIHQ